MATLNSHVTYSGQGNKCDTTLDNKLRDWFAQHIKIVGKHMYNTIYSTMTC